MNLEYFIYNKKFYTQKNKYNTILYLDVLEHLLSMKEQKVNYYKYSMILGMVCLAIDHIFCIKTPNFHALWHLFTALGAYFGSSFYVEYKNLITNISNITLGILDNPYFVLFASFIASASEEKV